MRHTLISRAGIGTLIVGLALPLAAYAANQANPEPGPCQQIVAACKSAGFVEGDYKKGYGLHVDCIRPIMNGTPQPPKADKPLPVISPQVVAACKQKNPNFGEGKKAAGK
jgi:hypothetical protein